MHRKILGPAGIQVLSLTQTHPTRLSSLRLTPRDCPTRNWSASGYRDTVPHPIWTHLEIFTHCWFRKTNSAGSAWAWQTIQGPSLSGFVIRENAICLLTKSRSINWRSNDLLQKGDCHLFSIWSQSLNKHPALHPCRHPQWLCLLFKVMVMRCKTLIPLAIVGVLTGHVLLEHFHGLKSNGFEVNTNN